MALCVPFVFGHFPSVGQVWSPGQVPGNLRLFARRGTASGSTTPACFIFGGIPWHCYFQRVLSSPTPAVARKLSLIAAGLCLLMAIPPALLGTAGGLRLARPGARRRLFGAAQVLRDMAPRWVILGLCAVAGAIMSSVDASIYSAAGMFSWNITMHRVLRPSEDLDLLARTNRRAIVVLGAAGTLIALNVRSIYTLWYLSANLVYVLLFPQLLVVLFWRAASARSISAGMAVALSCDWEGEKRPWESPAG